MQEINRLLVRNFWSAFKIIPMYIIIYVLIVVGSFSLALNYFCLLLLIAALDTMIDVYYKKKRDKENND